MKTLNLANINEQKQWIEKIRNCDWSAAKFLADLLEQEKFQETVGGGRLFIMTDADSLVSFATLSHNDCIKDESLFPWIGFVFTCPEYRRHRYSGEIIELACSEAKKQGYDKVYIATDHIGFYEKYGFTYIENRADIYGEDSRIYCKKLR